MPEFTIFNVQIFGGVLLFATSLLKFDKHQLKTKITCVLSVFWIVLCVAVHAARAERLPLRFYTSADGMASSVVNHVFKDSTGFLWFSTREGIARFDGRDFVNYRLPTADHNHNVAFVLETRGGTFLIGGSDGLYRIRRQDESSIPPKIQTAQKNDSAIFSGAEKVGGEGFQILYEDGAGRIWGGNVAGLSLLEEQADKIVTQRIELPAAAFNERQIVGVTSICEGADGSLWVGGQTGVVRLLPNGAALHYGIKRASDYDSVLSLAEDAAGRIFVGHSAGLFVFQPEPLESLKSPSQPDSRDLTISQQTIENSGEISLPEASGAMQHLIMHRPSKRQSTAQYTQVSKVFRASDGKIWATANGVLYVFENGAVRALDDERGLPINFLGMTEDADGNLWLATSSGAIRIARQGFTTFGRADGLFPLNIQSLHETTDKRFFAIFGDWRVAEILADGELKTSRLQMPDQARAIWGSTTIMPDRETGEWWALSEDGLYRFLQPDAAPHKVYGVKDGLKSDSLFCSFQDKSGNLWFSTRRSPEDAGLSRFDKQKNSFQTFSTAENFPANKSAMAFAEDTAGRLWLGFYQGGLARFRDNRFEIFGEEEGAPAGMLSRLHVDRSGRLWIASSRDGLTMIENPTAKKPVFKKFTVVQGLASNAVNSIAEDDDGNIYVGTVRGIDRFNVETGRIKHFSVADGLAADLVHLALRDRFGAMWFGTPNGLSRFEPQREKPHTPPEVLISNLQIAGQHYAVSEFGRHKIENIEVSAAENNLQINFLSVGDATNLRYQHRLEGANGGAVWSEYNLERGVNFANLAPGSYRFSVRAIGDDGVASENPASVSFTIRPPFWKTWEFIGAFVLLIGAGVFALDRYRVSKTRQVQVALKALRKSKEERLIELERVRTRIATDLHDDIGASLTQIAVLTEVARSQAKSRESGLDAPLAKVSGVATELTAAMGDIVWAINPRKDNLRDLVQRMRRFASDIFAASKIKFDFDAPTTEIDAPMGANLRRELYVIFKEAVNNIVRHAAATRAEISLTVFADSLVLKISDDGRGFDPNEKLGDSFAPDAGGNGLLNLRRRGADLGGRCEIISFHGGGTTVLLEIPLHTEDITIQIGSESDESNELG